MEVTLLGSGAMDNLAIARERDPGAFSVRRPLATPGSGTSGFRTR
jgi:hypothetical protein